MKVSNGMVRIAAATTTAASSFICVHAAPPTAVDDFATTDTKTSILISPLENDSDPDGNTLVITSFSGGGVLGSLLLSGNTFTYDPNGLFDSLAPGQTATETFPYTVDDGFRGIDSATVTITIVSPDAVDDVVTTSEDTSIDISPLDNDEGVPPLSVVAFEAGETSGSVALVDNIFAYNPTGHFIYLGAGESVKDSFDYTASDANGNTNEATVTVTVNGVNDAPIAADDSATTDQDQTVTISPLDNDVDPDENDSLVVASVSTAGTTGSVSSTANKITYDPNGQFALFIGESTTDSFMYTVEDGSGATDTATVTVTITGTLSSDPIGENDEVSTDEDTPVDIYPLVNDVSPIGASLVIAGVDTSGIVGWASFTDTSITYDPNDGFHDLEPGQTATDTFGYILSDDSGGVDQATVTVTIIGINHAPVAENDIVTTPEDSAVDIYPLNNDVDPDEGDTLTITGINNAGAVGSATFLATSITYDPVGHFALGVGETATDSFSYTVEDENGGTDTATVTVTVTAVNQAPVAQDDEATTFEGNSVTINPLENDSDPDGDTLEITLVDSAETSGSVAFTNTSITYDPDGNFDSLKAGQTATDTFSYTVDDAFGGRDSATVTVTVSGVNDAPVAKDDVLTTTEDFPATIEPLENDSDVDGDDVYISSTNTAGTKGQVSFTDTSVTYDPNGQFALGMGETATDAFAYTVEDGHGGASTATVTVTITPGSNSPPTATSDEATTSEDASVDILPLANDIDHDGDVLTITSVDTAGTIGQVSFTESSITYDPNGQFALSTGETATDTFLYTVSDSNGGTDIATVTVTVTNVNAPPVAADDETTTPENTAVILTPLVNDVDPDGDPITVTGVGTLGTVGVVSFTSNSIIYDPESRFDLATGETANDAFSYTVSDGNGGTDTATVTVTITGVARANSAPVANDDAASTFSDMPVDIYPAENDVDNDGDSLTITNIDTSGTLGFAGFGSFTGNTLTYNPNGQFDYLEGGETATDSFAYTVEDGHGGSDSATVTVTITGVSDQDPGPTAVDDVATTDKDAHIRLDPLDNDVDPAGGGLTITSVTAMVGRARTSGSRVQYNPRGRFNFLAAGDTAMDTLTYTIEDVNGDTDTGIVTVTVTGTARRLRVGS